MFSIETETNVEVLRSAALLLQAENDRLFRRVEELQVRLAQSSGEDLEQLALELKCELEKLHGALSPPASKGKAGAKGKDPKKTGHGPRDQPRLPRQTVIRELEPGELLCKVCGGDLMAMGTVTESTELIGVVRRQFVLETHECTKYRCSCNGAVVTTPGPERLQKGGRYSVEFGAEVAISKYLDHIPLERQVRAMAREGLLVDSQTLYDQLAALCKLLKPSYEELGRQVLQSPVLHVDETRWPLLSRKGQSPHSVFGLVNEEIAFYSIPSSKSTKAARKLLGKYKGTAVADGYEVYRILARAGPFELAHCWAHVLRRFRDLEDQHPEECSRMLGFIRGLYDIERSVTDAGGSESDRRKARQERSLPILKKIRSWCFEQGALPRSGLGKATRYVLKYWDGLTLFVENPKVPLDNNAVERALRGPVVGRKNHYGSKSVAGTKVAAILYTLCETAKLCGVCPAQYLADAAKAAIRRPGAVTLPRSGGWVERI